MSSSAICFFFLSSDSMRTWSFSIPVLICRTSSCVEFRREAISPFSSREDSRDCDRRLTSPSKALGWKQEGKQGRELQLVIISSHSNILSICLGKMYQYMFSVETNLKKAFLHVRIHHALYHTSHSPVSC